MKSRNNILLIQPDLLKSLRSLLLFLTVGACVEPIRLSIEGGGALVVDGFISDESGPYQVKLSRSIHYDNGRPLKVYSVPEQKAKVSIEDGEGNIEILAEMAGGIYQTQQLQGKIGGSYRLIIETSEGKRYRSQPETIRPVPRIEDLQYEYTISESMFINSAGDARIRLMEGFAIYIEFKDPSESKNFYRWKTDGIFEFFSDTIVPEVRQCWAPVARLEYKVETASDVNFNGKPFRQHVATVPYDRPTKYMVNVRQLSMSPEAYEFSRKLADQQTGTGTLFDPPPTAIKGNVFNESDSEEIVAGYFGAYGVTKARRLINRFASANFLAPGRNIPIRPGSCLTQEPGATNIKPEGF